MGNIYKKTKTFSMKGYFKCKKLGEGTYAIIYMAKVLEEAHAKIIKVDPSTSSGFVAIKKIKKTIYGLGQEISAIREIKVLKSLDHEYIVKLLDIFIHKNAIHLVLEYVEFDLEQILKNKGIIIMPGDIKAWMHMLLRGLFECHRRFFIHRDVKPNNLLISGSGVLKLADFGLTRTADPHMTVQAITRWYRAPEILLGAKSYSPAVDMWAVGAVFAEMFLRVPFFAGDTDLQQLDLIFQALGTPSEQVWPLVKDLPGYFNFKKVTGPSLGVIFTAASEDALDLLKKLLIFNPVDRITCIDALKHEYFINEPCATSIGNLPVPK